MAGASPFRATGAATCLPDHSEGRPRVDDRSKKALYEQLSRQGGPNTWRKRACGWSPQPSKTNSYTHEASQRRAAEAGAPHRGRGRAAHGSGEGQPMGAIGTVTMVLVAYRHGLRASELVDLRWDQVDFGTSTLHVRRVKTGTNSRPRRGHHARSRFTAFLPPKILYQALAAIAAGLPQGRSKPQES